MTKKTTVGKINLVATPEEVKYLQMVRDKRLAGQSYTTEKNAFFRAFREKYGITSDSRIKVETERMECLGETRFCGNNAPVKVLPVVTTTP